MRILYRVRQFWQTLFYNINLNKLEQAHKMLTMQERALFDQLQPAEKSHALKMVDMLLASGETKPELLTAALLHDIGKIRYRLNPIERTLVVLLHASLPRQAQRWGDLPASGWDKLPGWRKAFIVSAQHAEWGAEMARIAGSSPLTVELIRQHHCPPEQADRSIVQSLQHKLWLVDNES